MSIVSWEEKFTSANAVPFIRRNFGVPILESKTELVVTWILISDQWMSPRGFLHAPVVPGYLTPYRLRDESGTVIDSGPELLIRKEVVWGPTPHGNTQFACRINCTYGEMPTSDDAGGMESREPVPEDDVQIERSRVEKVMPLRHDWSTPRRPVVNTVGQKFFDPITITYHESLYRITRHEYRNPFAVQQRFEGRINHAAFWGFPPRTLKINGIDASYVPKKFGWNVTYEIETNRFTWDLMPLNQGTRTGQFEWIIQDWGLYQINYHDIVDKSGQPISDPVNLDANGLPIPENGTPYYFEDNPFVGYLAENFELLLLPNVMTMI